MKVTLVLFHALAMNLPHSMKATTDKIKVSEMAKNEKSHSHPQNTPFHCNDANMPCGIFQEGRNQFKSSEYQKKKGLNNYNETDDILYESISPRALDAVMINRTIPAHLAAKTRFQDHFRDTLVAAPDEPISFFVMGDAPYREMYMDKIKEDMKNLSGGEFVVHVGDTNNPRKHFCKRDWFHNVSQVLRASPVTALVLPGDNDILDCPEDQKRNFVNYYIKKHHNSVALRRGSFFEDYWKNGPRVKRQFERRENFSFVIGNTLFIGLHVIVQPDEDEHSALMSDNIGWVLRNLKRFKGDTLVIFGHQRPGRSMLRPMFRIISDEAEMRNLHFLYIHGNGHKYQTDEVIHGSMVRVQVDKGSRAPPLKVTIHPRSTYSAARTVGNQLLDNRFKMDRRQ